MRDNAWVWIFGAAAAALAVLLVVMWANRGPSCAERGGEREMTHFRPIFTGKTTVMAPVYRCRMPKQGGA